MGRHVTNGGGASTGPASRAAAAVAAAGLPCPTSIQLTPTLRLPSPLLMRNVPRAGVGGGWCVGVSGTQTRGARTSAVLFSTSALNNVLLPTLGRPTMPVLSAMGVTEARNPRAEAPPGAAAHPRTRPAAKLPERARSEDEDAPPARAARRQQL